MLSRSFLIAFLCSFIMSIINYTNTEGNEAKQVEFMLIFVNILLCGLNYIGALPGLLNLNEKVYSNIILSFLSFFVLPIALFGELLYLIIQNFIDINIFEILPPFIPSISFMIVLFIQFIKFRKLSFLPN